MTYEGMHSNEEERLKIEELKNLRSSKLKGLGAGAGMDKVFMLSEELQKANPDVNLKKYRFYHVLIGSGVSPEEVPDLDLPDASIEDAIRNKL